MHPIKVRVTRAFSKSEDVNVVLDTENENVTPRGSLYAAFLIHRSPSNVFSQIRIKYPSLVESHEQLSGLHRYAGADPQEKRPYPGKRSCCRVVPVRNYALLPQMSNDLAK
jgi:hypothetical protein